MNALREHPVRTIEVYQPTARAVFTIERTATLASVTRREILIYCKSGLVTPVVDPDDPEFGGYCFDDEAIRTLRRIERLRSSCGINLPGIKMVLSLMDTVENLRAELHLRRGKRGTPSFVKVN
jgi:DNA-binding transcriptional MerR regulator